MSLTCTTWKKHSLMKPSLSINLKIMATIFYLFDSSWASSTRIQNFASPISSWIAYHTLQARICKISFWIVGDIYLAFYGAFSKTALATLSLNVDVCFFNSIKLPHFLESKPSSWPLKAQAWNASHRAHSIEVLCCKQLFSIFLDVFSQLVCQYVLNNSLDPHNISQQFYNWIIL